MKTNEWTLRELNDNVFRMLIREFGPASAVRFLRQYERGRGDYTKDRHRWLDSVTIEEVEAELKQMRSRPQGRKGTADEPKTIATAKSGRRKTG